MASARVVLCLVLGVVAMVNCMPVDEPMKADLGSPFFDEIVVESTLTVRGKGGASRQSRGGKKLQVVPAEGAKPAETVQAGTLEVKASEGVVLQLTRPKRQDHFRRRQNNQQQVAGHRQQQNPFGNQQFGRPNFGSQGFPSGSASAANAQSQGFNVAGPNGFGASASSAGTQGFQFGPNGITGTAGQSASQVYRLPNGQTLNVAFSNGFNVGPNGGSQTGSNAITLTGADGRKQNLRG